MNKVQKKLQLHHLQCYFKKNKLQNNLHVWFPLKHTPVNNNNNNNNKDLYSAIYKSRPGALTKLVI